jgi:hypothetical protein
MFVLFQPVVTGPPGFSPQQRLTISQRRRASEGHCGSCCWLRSARRSVTQASARNWCARASRTTADALLDRATARRMTRKGSEVRVLYGPPRLSRKYRAFLSRLSPGSRKNWGTLGGDWRVMGCIRHL